MKKRLKTFISCVIILVSMWMVITTTIQRFKNHKMTETELLLAIPKSFILDFK